MIVIEDKSKCVGCGACVQSCPTKCISMQQDEEGFYYPRVNKEKCIDCGKCERVCPCINSFNDDKNKKTDIWCVKNKNEEIRSKSSSGGIFSEVASYVISKNGVVFGVALSDDCRLAKHIEVETDDGIRKLRGSKYLQSDIGDSYISVKKYLEQGREVLFSGTSCQIKGLKLFLKKEYENLVCVELICHGVSSQKLWEKYVDFIEDRLNEKILDVNFRSKKYGWHDFGIKFYLKDNNKIFKFNFENSYFNMFNSNFSLSPACYNCPAKDVASGADITLGDFWNIEKIYTNLDDNKGLSMVLLNTSKGKKIFEDINNNLFAINDKLDYELAKKCNPALYKSLTYNPIRDEFYKDMNQLTYEELEKKYSPMSTKIKVKSLFIRLGLWRYIKEIRSKHNS